MASNNAAYVELRTVLDSLEFGAIRYFLAGTSSAEMNTRMETVRTQLLPIIQFLYAQGEEEEIECPEGFNECNGVCVPYACPTLTEEEEEE
jgi:hypothetical protein